MSGQPTVRLQTAPICSRVAVRLQAAADLATVRIAVAWHMQSRIFHRRAARLSYSRLARDARVREGIAERDAEPPG
jgi:hypothetical protein